MKVQGHPQTSCFSATVKSEGKIPDTDGWNSYPASASTNCSHSGVGRLVTVEGGNFRLCVVTNHSYILTKHRNTVLSNFLTNAWHRCLWHRGILGWNNLKLHVKAVQICLVSVQVWDIFKWVTNIWKFDQSHICFSNCVSTLKRC